MSGQKMLWSNLMKVKAKKKRFYHLSIHPSTMYTKNISRSWGSWCKSWCKFPNDLPLSKLGFECFYLSIFVYTEIISGFIVSVRVRLCTTPPPRKHAKWIVWLGEMYEWVCESDCVMPSTGVLYVWTDSACMRRDPDHDVSSVQ